MVRALGLSQLNNELPPMDYLVARVKVARATDSITVANWDILTRDLVPLIQSQLFFRKLLSDITVLNIGDRDILHQISVYWADCPLLAAL